MSSNEVQPGGVVEFGDGEVRILPFAFSQTTSGGNVFDIDQALKQIFLQNALVVSIVAGRVYPGYLPQSAVYPALVYQIEGRDKDFVVEPGIGTVVKSEVHFYALSDSANAYAETKRLSEAVRLCLEGYSGTVTKTGSDPEETVEIQGIFFVTHQDHDDPVLKVRQANSIFYVWHNQT